MLIKCCRSTDSKVKALINHDKVKPIQTCRVHSGALDELTSQRSTGKCSFFFFLKFGQLALKFLQGGSRRMVQGVRTLPPLPLSP